VVARGSRILEDEKEEEIYLLFRYQLSFMKMKVVGTALVKDQALVPMTHMCHLGIYFTLSLGEEESFS
jgi:hypothetical protein